MSPFAIFTDISLPKDFGRTGGGDVKRRRHGVSVTPEIYARPDGTVYTCGISPFPISPNNSLSTSLLMAFWP